MNTRMTFRNFNLYPWKHKILITIWSVLKIAISCFGGDTIEYFHYIVLYYQGAKQRILLESYWTRCRILLYEILSTPQFIFSLKRCLKHSRKHSCDSIEKILLQMKANVICWFKTHFESTAIQNDSTRWHDKYRLIEK